MLVLNIASTTHNIQGEGQDRTNFPILSIFLRGSPLLHVCTPATVLFPQTCSCEGFIGVYGAIFGSWPAGILTGSPSRQG
jgi:hypothetical protein